MQLQQDIQRDQRAQDAHRNKAPISHGNLLIWKLTQSGRRLFWPAPKFVCCVFTIFHWFVSRYAHEPIVRIDTLMFVENDRENEKSVYAGAYALSLCPPRLVIGLWPQPQSHNHTTDVFRSVQVYVIYDEVYCTASIDFSLARQPSTGCVRVCLYLWIMRNLANCQSVNWAKQLAYFIDYSNCEQYVLNRKTGFINSNAILTLDQF